MTAVHLPIWAALHAPYPTTEQASAEAIGSSIQRTWISDEIDTTMRVNPLDYILTNLSTPGATNLPPFPGAF